MNTDNKDGDDEPKEAPNEGKIMVAITRDIKSLDSAPIRPEVKKYLIPILRRATYRWRPREEAFRAARVTRGKYKCAMCSELFGPKEVDKDHKDPVVSIKDGFKDWNVFIDRLFPPVEGWQILCKTCHEVKTIEEDSMRSFYNQQRKAEAKKQNKKKKPRKK